MDQEDPSLMSLEHQIAAQRQKLGEAAKPRSPQASDVPAAETQAFWVPYLKASAVWYGQRRLRLGNTLITHEYRVEQMKMQISTAKYPKPLLAQAVKSLPLPQKANYISEEAYDKFKENTERARLDLCEHIVKHSLRQAIEWIPYVVAGIRALPEEMKLHFSEKVQLDPQVSKSNAFMPAMLSSLQDFMTLDYTTEDNDIQRKILTLLSVTGLKTMSEIDADLRERLNRAKAAPAKARESRHEALTKEKEKEEARERHLASLSEEKRVIYLVDEALKKKGKAKQQTPNKKQQQQKKQSASNQRKSKSQPKKGARSQKGASTKKKGASKGKTQQQKNGRKNARSQSKKAGARNKKLNSSRA